VVVGEFLYLIQAIVFTRKGYTFTETAETHSFFADPDSSYTLVGMVLTKPPDIVKLYLPMYSKIKNVKNCPKMEGSGTM